ncbi:MAG: NADH:flavin oxidoreductase/NADH oxidase [Paludibacter sp.]|nr:NADH:flavin oxidoreductase/NADH oxidase [Paludibacter sp.]
MYKINDPLTIKSVTFRNRIGMSPMCQYSSINGFANNWHNVHYGTRAVGGVGLIILEATAIVPEGRITPYDLGLWNDDQITELKKITEFIRNHGSIAGIQIAHAGRKASHDSPSNGGKQLAASEGGWQTVAPSSIPFETSEIAPNELNQAEINTIIEQFKDTASRAKVAGFKVMEIHAAHGYLIHQFYSPLSNKRTDKYGGSFENRIRLLLEITAAVQSVWPKEYPLFVRLSASDWTEGGWDLNQTAELSKLLHKQGVDLIDCSSGGNIATAKVPVAPGYQVHFSEEIKKIGVMTSAVGLITSIEQANNILEEGKADMILLARELLRNPYFALKIENTTWPNQYLRAK